MSFNVLNHTRERDHPSSLASLGQPTLVTADNISSVTKHMRWRVRSVLKLLLNARSGSLILTTPEGQSFKFIGEEAGPNADLNLHNWRLPLRAASLGSIGAAESYIDGDWNSSDVTEFLSFFLVNSRGQMNMTRGKNRLMVLFQQLRHWMNDNSKSGSKRNISAHYDLGNAFYAQWLDPTMTYSSALFDAGMNDLEAAQKRKYRALCEAMDLKAGESVLEIGCGWGGFAEVAAGEFGAHVTGLTISREQFDYAVARMNKAGLQNKVMIKFQDYRDETGKYDHVASIEMFEAVGERYWPTYFDKVRQCLKPDGKAGLQIITINNHDFATYRKRPDFIQRYVFPGGMLPSPKALQKVTSDSGLSLVDERIFGRDYAKTLAIWREHFFEAWPRIEPLGFDERFKRLWAFYLHYCETGFDNEFIDVRQMIYRASKQS